MIFSIEFGEDIPGIERRPIPAVNSWKWTDHWPDIWYIWNRYLPDS